MVCHAPVHVFVLLAAIAAMPHHAAASQQSDELKQIKADFKLALSQAKSSIDGTVSILTDDLAILQVEIGNGTELLSNVADDLTDKVLTAAHDIQEATRDASNSASASVFTDATVTLANATLGGGGGDFDKFRAALDALQAKAFKKMQGLLKKFQKSAASSSPSAFAVNVLLLPFPPSQPIFSDHDTSSGSNIVPTNFVSVLVGTSAGEAAVGGIAFGGCTITVNNVDIVSPADQKWKRVIAVTAGNTATFSVLDPAVPFNAVQGYLSIGVPAP